MHFVQRNDVQSALPYVRQGKNVIVTPRGQAGADRELESLSRNVISIVAARRRSGLARPRQRTQTCAGEDASRTHHVATRPAILSFIEPSANFLMIDAGRNAREFIIALPKLGIAPGRPFPDVQRVTCLARSSQQCTIGNTARIA